MNWQKEKYDLLVPENHSEIFLEWRRNVQFQDFKTGESHSAEIVPFSRKNKMEIYHVHPPMFETTEERNSYKIQVLKDEKEQGRDYYLKGTLNVAPNISELCELYKDRRFILSERENKIDLYMSFLYAWKIKLFHAHDFNYKRYLEQMVPVKVDVEQAKTYKNFVDRMEKVKRYMVLNNIDHEVVTYEELEDEDVISELVDTDEWKSYRKDEHNTTLHIEKDYRKLIINYSEVVDVLKDIKAI